MQRLPAALVVSALAAVGCAQRGGLAADRKGSPDERGGESARRPASAPERKETPMAQSRPRRFVFRPKGPRPAFRDFMGINGHTVQFRPQLYSRTCLLARDYHNFNWDVGDETNYEPRFPSARNGVNWEDVYGRWKKEGFDIDVSIMFGRTPPESWVDLPRDAYNYGRAFAAAFGPSSKRALVTAAEIGNEPGGYDDATYRTLFESMARGLRAGDPRMLVATCNVTVGESGKYDKNVECVKGLEKLYDVLNIHVYPLVEGWPTWRRSYPEDPKIDYLKRVDDLIAWRDRNAPGKEVWVTEFGYDACTKPATGEGTFGKWEDVSDEKQAQYLVRSFLVFSRRDVARAYVYFFNDSDSPAFHASSGLTRNYEPKPSYHAVAHMFRTLGEYRLEGVAAEEVGGSYVYEFAHVTDPARKIVVAWSATGSGRRAPCEIPLGRDRFVRAEEMPLREGPAPAVRAHGTWRGPAPSVSVEERDGSLRLAAGESPVYVWLEARR